MHFIKFNERPLRSPVCRWINEYYWLSLERGEREREKEAYMIKSHSHSRQCAVSAHIIYNFRMQFRINRAERKMVFWYYFEWIMFYARLCANRLANNKVCQSTRCIYRQVVSLVRKNSHYIGGASVLWLWSMKMIWLWGVLAQAVEATLWWRSLL